MMQWHFTPYLIPLVVSVLIAVLLAILAWRRQPAPGVLPFTWMMLAIAVWVIAYALELASVDLSQKFLWSRITYFGILCVPTAWLIFALQYTDRDRWLTRRNLLALAIIPLLTLALSWTTESNGWFLRDFRLEDQGGYSILRVSFGPAFYIHAAYSYLLLIVGTVLILRAQLGEPHLFLGQKFTLVGSLLIPWIANIMSVFGLIPTRGLDFTPFTFVISGIGLVWSLFGFRLLDLVPVARQAIFDSMTDGVLVIDAHQRIREINPAAARSLRLVPARLTGKPLASLFARDDLHPFWRQLEPLLQETGEKHLELVLGSGEDRQSYDLRTTPLFSRTAHFAGWLIVLRDITQWKFTQEHLYRRTTYLEVFNHIIAASAIATDLQRVMAIALEGMLQVLGPDRGGVWLMGEEARHNLPEEAGAIFARYDQASTSTGKGILTVEDWERGQEGESTGKSFAQEILRLGVRASVIVPIWIGERWVGRLGVMSSSPRTWRAEESAWLDAIGRQLGVAAERLLAFKETQDHDVLMGRLVTQGEALSRHYTLQEVAEAISQGALTLLKPDRVQIYLSGEQEAASMEDRLLMAVPEAILLEEGPPARLPPSPKPVLVSDTQQVLDQAQAAEAQTLTVDYRAIGLWPMVYESRTVAVVGLYYDHPHIWTDLEQEVMQAFARQAAVALENARLFEAERNQRTLAETLRDLASTVNSKLNYAEVLERILDNLGRVVPHDRAELMLVEEGIARVASSLGKAGKEVDQKPSYWRLPVKDSPTLVQMSETGKPCLYPETSGNPLWEEAKSKTSCRSYMGAPILRKGQVIGFINAYSAQPGFYTQVHEENLRVFSEQVGIALENADLYDTLQKQVAETSALYRALTQLFGPGIDLETLAYQITQAVTTEFSSAHCSLLVADDWSNQLRFLAQSGYQQSEPKPLYLTGSGLTVAAFRGGGMIYAPDVSHDSRYIAGSPITRSELVFPLRARDQVIGVLNLESPELDAFDERARRVLTAFAEQAALALENGYLFERASQYAEQMNLLNEITRCALEVSNFKDMLQAIADRLRELFQADDCYITLWDEEQGRARTGAASGPMRDIYSTVQPEDGEASITETVLNSNLPIAIEDVSESTYISPRIANLFTTRSVLGLPMIADNQKFGAALIGFNSSRRFTQRDLHIGEQAAGQIALAIARARLLEVSQRRAQEAENLRQATAELSAALDLYQVLDNILAYLDQVITFDSSCMFLLEGDHLHAVATMGFPKPDRILGQLFPANDPLWQEIIRQGRPVVLEDAQTDLRFHSWGDVDYIRGWMGVPLISHGTVIGCLTLDSREAAAFTKEHADLAQAFASQAAAAIENAHLFAEVQRLAVTDPLTGLYNRRGYSDLGRREVERARRYKRPLSAIMVDIDYFKLVNDTYQHAVGDQVLRQLAERCRKGTREIDIVGRYGGEEIIILLPETDLKGALSTAEHLRADVVGKPFETDSGSISITVSMGVTASQDGEVDLDELIGQADSAMYLAKRAGRNRVRKFARKRSSIKKG